MSIVAKNQNKHARNRSLNPTKTHFQSLLKQLVVLSSVVLVSLTILSFFAPVNWTLDLLSHFRLQLSLGLLALTLVWIYKKKSLPALLLTTLLILNSVLLVPFFLPSNWRAAANLQTSTNTQQTRYRFLFANINYGNQDLSHLVDMVAKEKPNIIVTVETHGEHFATLQKELGQYPYSYHIPRGKRLGTAIFSQLPFVSEPSIILDTTETYPTVRVELPTANSLQSLVVYAIHPPPPITPKTTESRNEIFAKVAESIQKEVDPVIALGDFNSTSWSPHFRDLLTKSELEDTRTGEGIQPSWPTFLPKLLRIPIDHVLISDDITVFQRTTLPSIGSDHLPILVDIGL